MATQQPEPVTIVNVGYRSTNYYVVGAGSARLLIDLGWPGSWAELTGALKRKGLTTHDLTHAFATHYHPDHAGLAQELKRAGLTLIVIDAQVDAIPLLAQMVKPTDGYLPLTLDGARVLSASASRAYLARLGIAGEIIATPGHSDDSMTLVLDSGAAFTGDLTAPWLAFGDGQARVLQSWAEIRRSGVTTVYPGHGPAGPVPPALEATTGAG